MIFASNLLGSIHENSLGYEWKLRSIEHQLSEAASQELRLEQQIATKLSEIADLHLEHRPELEQEARDVLDLRDAEERELRKRLEQVERTISDLLEKIDARQADLRRLKRQVADMLAGRKEYRQMLTRFEEAQERRRTAEPNQRELQEECARKLPQYRQDARYAYLVSAGYATDAYRGTGIRRFLDGWIARLCNFHENHRNEMTLLAMQDALARTEEETRQELQALSDRLAAATASEEEATGMRSLKEELARLEEAVKAQKKHANEIHALLAPYAAKADTRYVQARSLVAVALKEHSEEELMARVLQTPGLADDKLAREVVDMQAALQAQRRRIAELEQQRTQADTGYQRAKELERTLRHRGYAGGHYGYHSGLNLGSLLVGYMAGQLTVDQAAQELGQYRQPIQDDYPYNHLPQDWGFGGDFASSDAFGGDGFSTTDSF